MAVSEYGQRLRENAMFVLFPAETTDEETCWNLIEEGRRFQYEQGFVQWTEAYPRPEHVRADIAEGKAYLLKDEQGTAAGYICIDFAGEPAYETIRGRWSSDEPFAVLHRMTLGCGFRGCGLGSVMLRECERVCRERHVYCLRADTSPENKRMQHVFEKNGYRLCGTVRLRGNEKMAYDKCFGQSAAAAEDVK